MLLKSYTKKYLYTYFWQGISVILNLCSLLIVIPLISENKFIYGIYSICVSFSIFLNYADLGFVSAAVKYAGELYAQNKREEIKFYGFSTFILIIFISLIVLTFIYFSYNPQILIKDIVKSNHLELASSLLLIQALFSYNVVLQKYTASVFQVRIEQYIFQRLSIVGNIIKISSVFYFLELVIMILLAISFLLSSLNF